MSCCCGRPGCVDPRCRQGFTKLTSFEQGNTLARELIPVADDLRDLLTQFGLRPYLVRIVKTRWSGGERGSGVEEVVEQTDILPTPRIYGLDGITELLTPIGLDEAGGIQIKKISGRYTEEELRYGASRAPAADDENILVEIEFPIPGDGDSVRRRFTLRGAPEYWPGGLQWMIRLERARADRGLDGSPG